jgi:hypothetical protein
MFEKGIDVQIAGKDYRFVFTTAAMKAVGLKFGGIKELGERMEVEKIGAIEDVCWLIALLANQGIMLATRNVNPSNPDLLSPELVELLTMPPEIESLTRDALKAIELGMEIEHTPIDEAVDVTLEEIRQKEKKSLDSPAT